MRFLCRMLLCLSLAGVTLAANAPKIPKHKSKSKNVDSKAGVAAKRVAREAEADTEGMPTAMAEHLERLRRALPGNGGLGGPSSPEEEAFQHMAYPGIDIPAARFESLRSNVRSIHGRPFARGRGQQGAWMSVGPSNAVYPLFQFRTSGLYVPNEYVASGRTTSLAVANHCVRSRCTLYAGPAGGGVWRTRHALDDNPRWAYLSTPFGINSTGSVVVDPNDPNDNTIWVGTGEANASADSVAGVGLYKSTDGGETWVGPIGGKVFNNRAIGTIAIKPGDSHTIYVGITRGVRGLNSTDGGGVSVVPGAAQWGLYKTTDGGATWTFIHNGSSDPTLCSLGDNLNTGPCSPRGVRRAVIDPSDPSTVYASSYARGVWRSNDGGTTWTQIKASLNSASTVTRAEFAVNKTPDGRTRMYVNEGNDGTDKAAFFRADDVAHGSPTFTQLSSNDPANPGYGAYNMCTGQCWYDNLVVSPAGTPDLVYVLGSYQYGETGRISNGRGVVLSTDGGTSFTDMTMDATDPTHPNGIHPDQHFLVVNPSNPYQFWESSDGGIIMSSGSFADISASCSSRGLISPALDRCQQLLSRVPTQLQSVNQGLSTLQFQSLSVNPFDSNDLQGGTQDNGTWENYGNPVKWLNTMIGDGGQSGFDIAKKKFRFHTFYDAQVDVNFSSGDTIDWNWIADPIFLTEPQQFYVPIISDPKVSGTMFVGTGHVWRTKTQGLGSMTVDQLRTHCNEWTGDFRVTCGDWQPLGDPTSAGRLTAALYGDRAGGDVGSVRRASKDRSTLWAATSVGRVFISKNADADPASSVVFTRIDIATSPNRYISDVAVDPANPNHAWIAYNGFNATLNSIPGHVFEVTFDPVANSATWVNRDYDLGDVPLNAVAYDNVEGDLYVSTDYSVLKLDSDGTPSWRLAAPGMPNVEVPGLTMVPGARKLYAATHGLGAWLLNLN